MQPLDTAYNSGFPAAWEGLGFESADAATPRLYGVSIGDGNDGVSRMYPAMHCRTTEPHTLAAAYLIGQFKPEYQDQAAEEMDLDGEAAYEGATATLYDPLDRDPPEYNHYCNECHHEWSDTDETPECCPSCDSENDIQSEELECESWSSVNGAYRIVEVFLVPCAMTLELDTDGKLVECCDTEEPSRVPLYVSLEECFGADAPELQLAREVA